MLAQHSILHALGQYSTNCVTLLSGKRLASYSQRHRLRFFGGPVLARRKQALMLCCISLLLLLLTPAVALAHPLGNFTVNRYSRLTVTGQQVQLVYIVDMAEIPAHQERSQIDRNGDNTIDAAEQDAYVQQLLTTLQTGLHVQVNGQAQPWTFVDADLTFPTGQAGLPTLRLVTQWSTPLAAQASLWQAAYRDENYADRIGWQEVVVQAGAGAALQASSAPAKDLSQELRTYPDTLLQSPLAVNQATFRFVPVAGSEEANSATAAPVSANAPAQAGRPVDPFAELIHLTTPSLWTILLALLAAFGWGAAHAFSPGHGKTIVGAYLVGSRGTVRHALFLGLTTTITHTAGVFALGFVTLFAAQFILPEKLYPWLSMASGVLVVTIGAIMIKDRLQTFLQGREHHHHHDHDQHGHDHGHADHEHPHSHAHGGHHHHHLPPVADDANPLQAMTWRNLLALGISGGLLPCPSALVLMLGAISLQRVGFGLALIVMFSLGLASVLTAIGVVLVYAGKFFQRIPESGPLFRFVPVASALFITVVGVGITVQALMSMGIFTLT